MHGAAAEFDAFAANYDAVLQQGLAVTGEDKDYYAQQRVAWLGARLRALGVAPQRVLDFGCGTGASTPYLLAEFLPTAVHGVDVSRASITVAVREHGAPGVSFGELEALPETARFDLAFCNGVFHHIPPEERADAAAFVLRRLSAGGVFALWENNPLNPGTRYVMARIPFDADAQTLTPWETRDLLRGAGFEVLGTDFLFYFPRVLRALRPAERLLCKVPLGGQYLVLCRKPVDTSAS
jgi:SAM-dependent methyltransferase